MHYLASVFWFKHDSSMENVKVCLLEEIVA